MQKIERIEYRQEYIHLTPFSSGSFFRMTGIEPTSLPIHHFTYKLPERKSYSKWGKIYRESYLEELVDIFSFNCVSYNREMKSLGFLCPYNIDTVYRDIERVSIYLFDEHVSSPKRYKSMIYYDFTSLSDITTYKEAVMMYENKYKKGSRGINFYRSIKVDGELERVIMENSKEGKFVYGWRFLDRYGTSRGSVRNICSKLGIKGKYEEECELSLAYRVKKHDVIYSQSKIVDDGFNIDDYLECDEIAIPMSANWLDSIRLKDYA